MERRNRHGAGTTGAIAIVAAGLTITAVSSALAQQQLPPRVQPGVIERPVARPPGDVERERQEIPSLAPRPETVTNPTQVLATLTDIQVKGAAVLPESVIRGITAKYLNRPVTRGEVAELKYEISKAYYDRGYILVQVVTPQQDVSRGVLLVEIYEARVGTMTVNNDNVLRPHVVEALSQKVKPGDVFQEQPVESMVNDFNDLTNVDATLNLRQGQQFGTTDMLLNLAPSNEDVNRVTMDNWGSKTTGRYVGAVNLQKSNYFKFGEKLNLDAFISNDITWGGSGGVLLPTGLDNIFFDARYIRTHIELSDDLEPLNSTGRSEIWEVAVSKKFINMRRMVIEGRGGFQWRDHRSFNDDQRISHDEIRQFFVQGSYLTRRTDFLGYASLRLVKGVDVLGAIDQGNVMATRPNGDPEVALFQPLLFATYRPLPKGEIRAQMSGQYATHETLASDLFVVGGQGSVRGFEPAQATGENGVQASLQYDHTVWEGPWEGFNWTAAVGPFVDAGWVFNRNSTAFVPDSGLVAAGFGGQIETDVVKVGTTRLRVDVAFPIGNYESTSVGTVFTYFRLTQNF